MSIPAAIIGFFLQDLIDEFFKGTLTISFMLIIIGITMTLSNKFAYNNDKKINSLTPEKSLLIGFFQSLAFIRGTSRSAITIIGGLSNKLKMRI